MRRESVEALGGVSLPAGWKLSEDGTEILMPREELSGFRERLPELAGEAASGMVRFYGEPQNQAYLFGCVAGAVIMPARVRLIPGLLFVMGCGLAARSAWSLADSMRSDLRKLARTAKDDA